jgi:hypothetical protein
MAHHHNLPAPFNNQKVAHSASHSPHTNLVTSLSSGLSSLPIACSYHLENCSQAQSIHSHTLVKIPHSSHQSHHHKTADRGLQNIISYEEATVLVQVSHILRALSLDVVIASLKVLGDGLLFISLKFSARFLCPCIILSAPHTQLSLNLLKAVSHSFL